MALTRAKEDYLLTAGDGIRFLMQDGRIEVPCRVSHEALTDRGAHTGLGQEDVFLAYREDIEQAASDKYDQVGKPQEGPLVVTTTEFPPRP
jgi:hypothetical protein